jgi:hypothetical protein
MKRVCMSRRVGVGSIDACCEAVRSHSTQHHTYRAHGGGGGDNPMMVTQTALVPNSAANTRLNILANPSPAPPLPRLPSMYV